MGFLFEIFINLLFLTQITQKKLWLEMANDLILSNWANLIGFEFRMGGFAYMMQLQWKKIINIRKKHNSTELTVTSDFELSIGPEGPF